MDSHTERMVPPLVALTNDVRLINLRYCDKKTPGPGDLNWEASFGGTSLGPLLHLNNSTRSRDPARDPSRPSVFACAPSRSGRRLRTTPADGRTDAVYKPMLPDYDVWAGKGFAQPHQERLIAPETWTQNVRELRDAALTAAG